MCEYSRINQYGTLSWSSGKEADAKVRDSNLVKVGVVPEGFPISDGIPEPSLSISQSEFRVTPEFQFRVELRDTPVRNIMRKIERAGVRLGNIYYINWGLRTGTDEKTARLITSDGRDPLAKRLIRGENTSTGISSSGPVSM